MPSKRRARKALTQLSQTKAALGFVGGKKYDLSKTKGGLRNFYSKSEPAIKGAPTTVKEAKQNLKMKKQTRRKSIRGQVGYRIKSKLAGVKTAVVTSEKRSLNNLGVPINPISVVQRRKNRKGFTVKGSTKVFKKGDKKFNKKLSQALGGVRGFATKATQYVAGENTPFAVGAPNPASTKIKFSTLRKTLSPRVKEARQQLKQLRKAKRK